MSALIIALALLSQPAFAQEGIPDGDIEFATDVIKARCVFCHSPMLMLALANRYTESAGLDGLSVFLSTHHAPDEEGRAAIVDFLSRLLPAQ